MLETFVVGEILKQASWHPDVTDVTRSALKLGVLVPDGLLQLRLVFGQLVGQRAVGNAEDADRE